jgi:AcrR family transcriptional regulator
MSKAVPSPSVVPANGRERLIESAIHLFGRDGFDATSVRALAEEADVSWGLVRFYFGSKEGLREAAEERVAESYLALVGAGARVGSLEELMPIIEARSAGLSEVARFLRRAIMEERPIADDFVRRLLSTTQDSLRESHRGGAEAWMEDPTRVVVTRLGYLLLAPQILSLLGRDVYSIEELKARNTFGARIQHLIELGLEAEREASQSQC